MSLSKKQKKLILNDLRDQYSKKAPGMSINDIEKSLERDKIQYDVFSIDHHLSRLVFVLFDATDHRNKENIVKDIAQKYKYSIGHAVHYQFDENGEYLGLVLSDEMTPSPN